MPFAKKCTALHNSSHFLLGNAMCTHSFFMQQAFQRTQPCCIKRSVGALAVRNNTILLHATNTPLIHQDKCLSLEHCPRKNAASGENLEYCWALHAEQNLIIQALQHNISLCAASVYVTTQPCFTCTKMLVASGVTAIYYCHTYSQPNLSAFVEQLQQSFHFVYQQCTSTSS